MVLTIISAPPPDISPENMEEEEDPVDWSCIVAVHKVWAAYGACNC